MSSSENTNLVMTTLCVHCGQLIELVLLTSQESGEEHCFWRHVTGFYTCYNHVDLVTPGNQAAPNWDELGQLKSTDCAGGCCYNAFKDECVDAECECHTYE